MCRRPRASCPVGRGVGAEDMLGQGPPGRSQGAWGPPALSSCTGGGLCVGQLIITESGDTGKQRGEKAGLMHLTFLENRGGQVFLPHEINVP